MDSGLISYHERHQTAKNRAPSNRKNRERSAGGSAAFRAASLWLTENGSICLRLRLSRSEHFTPATQRHSLVGKKPLSVSHRLTARKAAEPQGQTLLSKRRRFTKLHRLTARKAAKPRGQTLSRNTRSIAAVTRSTGTRLIHSGSSNFSQK
jgi:hypothetical protein